MKRVGRCLFCKQLLLLCLGRLFHHMQSAVVWSQSTMSSSRATKPSVPFGGWYRGSDRPFAPLLRICSSPRTPNPIYAFIVERNSPTPVLRQFSLTHEGLGRVIPFGEGPGDGVNVWRREVFFYHSIFHLWSVQKAAVVLDLSRSFSSSSAAATKGCRNFSSRCCVVGVNSSRSWRRCSGFTHGGRRQCCSFLAKLSVGNTCQDKKIVDWGKAFMVY